MNLVHLFEIYLLHLVLVGTDALSIEKTISKSKEIEQNLNFDLTTTRPIITRSNKNANNMQHTEVSTQKTNNTLKEHLIIKKSNVQPTNPSNVESTIQAGIRSNIDVNVEKLNDSINSNKPMTGSNEMKKSNFADQDDLNRSKTLSSLLEEPRVHNKKSRSRREPRGGRIGGKGGGSSTGKRPGAKQDGNEGDEDSGASAIKPILSLVGLSVLFLIA